MLATDEQLTTAAVAGDAAALRQLLRRHDGDLRALLAGKIRKTHRSAFDVEDVLQVTYLEVFLRIRDFSSKGPGSFRAWLLRIAENNLKDAIRGLEAEKRPPRNKQVVLPRSDESYVTLFSMLGGTKSTPSKHMAKQDARSALEHALKQLPPDYETVVRLNDLEGKPAAEVAQIMNRTVVSVYMLKARAHTRLAELIGSASRF